MNATAQPMVFFSLRTFLGHEYVLSTSYVGSLTVMSGCVPIREKSRDQEAEIIEA